ncbi:MAG TPA: hypothetical protein VFZ25_18950 [Chloroflexota bacterium]|nr:hypothetical protein [Chloroflexota bacterium]
MAIGIFRAWATGGLAHLEVCPNLDPATRACGCAKDAAGNPVPGHAVHGFALSLPAGDGRTLAAWLRACVSEAIRLETASGGGVTDLSGLVGLTS